MFALLNKSDKRPNLSWRSKPLILLPFFIYVSPRCGQHPGGDASASAQLLNLCRAGGLLALVEACLVCPWWLRLGRWAGLLCNWIRDLCCIRRSKMGTHTCTHTHTRTQAQKCTHASGSQVHFHTAGFTSPPSSSQTFSFLHYPVFSSPPLIISLPFGGSGDVSVYNHAFCVSVR